MGRLKPLLVGIAVLMLMFTGCATLPAVDPPRGVPTKSPVVMLVKRPPMGLIYSHTVTPLDLNLKETRQGPKQGSGDIKHFSYTYITFMWDSNAIYDIAKKQGMETIYYADLETLRILGLWRQYKVHIYGR